MKLAGKKIEGANVEICVIPRGTNESIVFKASAVLDMTQFDSLCPRPKPPAKILKGGKKVEDLDAPAFKNALDTYASRRVAFLVLKSLQATDNLEWETVDFADAETWLNYDAELRSSGFSDIEVMRIVNTVMEANCLSESRLEQARDSFLASQQEIQSELSFPRGEQDSMASGEPAKD